ncbi:uncharacterized protein LOC124164392 [Ischnura elegans]|uniref:uncharacterized protein LOC124164392 n=1 Tax=Ischnura elegans TaxID=197161 RepID=UPI001ED86C0F|nr:uncharacterized protein LOC124164392 [Ischnura elegans]
MSSSSAEDVSWTTASPSVLGSVVGFSWLDYFLFSLMLVASALIGVYFAFFAKQKQNSTQEYLMGGKNMGLIPVTLSLIASWVSGITLLGMPAEIYTYGTQYWTSVLGLALSTVVTGVFFLPVIHKLQITTSYEYLAIRFCQKVRVLGSMLFIISHFLYIPIVIYLPALAFSQVTGVSLHLITPVVCVVCIFYTSLGGLKAVVWTDAIQTVAMFGSMAVVAIAGTVAVGGPSTVWQRNAASGRIEFFNTDIDPTARHTFWNVIFGFSFMWMTALAANQGMMQRFLAMKTITMCYKMLIMYWFGVVILASLSCYSGLLIFATYHDCDLISSKKVNAPDQVLPYYVMDVTGYLRGLPGLFMAGVSSAALSTMSTGLNAMSGVIFEDFILPLMKEKPTEERSSTIMKIICVVLGVICVAMVFVVENLGAVIQLSASFSGITSGPLLALFALGMFFPWTNTKGTLAGGYFGLIVMGWIVLSAQYRISSGKVKLPVKPMSTAGCPVMDNVNGTSVGYSALQLSATTSSSEEYEDESWFILRISYTLYSFMGFVLSMTVGLAVSWFTRSDEKAAAVHPDLITPLMRKFYGLNGKTKTSPESKPLNAAEDITYTQINTEDTNAPDVTKDSVFTRATEMTKLTKEEESNKVRAFKMTQKKTATLVNYMSDHREFALGKFEGPTGRADHQKLWEEQADILALHGPLKTLDQWKKINVDIDVIADDIGDMINEWAMVNLYAGVPSSAWGSGVINHGSNAYPESPADDCVHFKGFDVGENVSLLKSDILSFSRKVGFEEVNEEEVEDLLNAQHELSDEEFIHDREEETHGGSCSDEMSEEPEAAVRTLKNKEIARAFCLIEEALQIFEDGDPDEIRSSKVNREVNAAIGCYRQIYKENSCKAKQLSLDAFFKKAGPDLAGRSRFNASENLAEDAPSSSNASRHLSTSNSQNLHFGSYKMSSSSAEDVSWTTASPSVLRSVVGFSWLDYFLFSLMLVASALIGIYFAFFAKQKQNSTQEYLMGGKNMGLIPVTLSLIASWVSGITLLGMPAEVYTYGTQFWPSILGLAISTAVTGAFFMPVIHKLQVTTSYEYLAIRFSQKVRILGSMLFIISHILYIPIVIYLPALAFSQVTGVSLHLITPVVCLVCIFYTSLGGMKAVVWTDAIQTVAMIGSMAVVAIAGTVSVGGPSAVWQKNEESGRIEFFNLDPDPTVRHTFWNVIFGLSFMWMTSLAANQGMVQRFLAMKTVQMCYKMLVMYWVGAMLLMSMSCYSGLLIYATYHNCDLISSKRVNAPDQVLPYYVMDVTGYIKGLPGLFMAGVSSAALSTMSTGLNAMSGVIFEDFILPLMKEKPTEERSSTIMKIICAVLGVICVAMVFVVENLGAVIQLSASFSGITSGPLLALFALGMFFPWTNTKGTLAGGYIGLLAMGWIVISSQYRISSGKVKLPVKPMSTAGCPALENINSTFDEEYSSFETSASTPSYEEYEDESWFIHRISYTWYSFMGFFLTMVVGMAVSWFTRSQEKAASVHPDLITPLMRKYYGLYGQPENTKTSPECNPSNAAEDPTYTHISTEDTIDQDVTKDLFIEVTEMTKLTKKEGR